MNEKLQNFFSEQENSHTLEKQKQRNEHLIDLGLYEKVYSGKRECSEEYPFIDQEGNSYKKVGIPVTDDEYRSCLLYTSGRRADRGRGSRGRSLRHERSFRRVFLGRGLKRRLNRKKPLLLSVFVIA